MAGAVQAQTPAQPPAAPTTQDQQQLRDELERLRKEFEAIRDAYGQRLSALEAKLGAAGAAPSQPSAVTPGAVTPPQTAAAGAPAAPAPTVPATAGAPEAQVPTGAAGAGGPQGALPVYGNPSAMSKIFNPDMAVIGNFVGATGKNEIAPLPALQLNEAEASFQAIVDPYARADFFISVGPEGADLEEGFLTLTSLPGGFLAKVGKMKEQIGKVNTQHAHTLSWIDVPLANQNLLGGEEGTADSGISVSKLIPNPILFLEATGEIFQGNAGIFQSHKRGNVSWVGRLRGYRDVTEAANIDIGASYARGTNDIGPDFKTGIFAVDATFRYRPLQRAIYRRFLARTELFWSRREQENGTVPAFGMYLSSDYQVAQRWFAGARYDWSERAYDSSLKDKGPSVLLTFWPSEFSQVRGQLRHINYAEGVKSNELLFQFLFSIGAHGAHVF